MILEDAHGNYIDRAAFNAAYNALVANGFIKLAQARGDVAEKIVVELMKRRATQGTAALREHQTAVNVAEAVKGQISESYTSVTDLDLMDAATAAGASLAGEDHP